MPTERILMIAAAALAAFILVRMMRNRQSRLSGLLRQYVDRQKEWALKRAKAAAMARNAAKTKERSQEDAATVISEMLNATSEPFPEDSPNPVET